MRVSGRRAFPRFRVLGAWFGRLRTPTHVTVNPNEPLTIMSDSPGVVDDEFTLALVRGADQMDVRVRVVATSPRMLDGVLCHQLTLEVLEQRASADVRVWTP